MRFFASLDSDVEPFYRAELTFLFVKKALISICSKYTDFTEIFSSKFIVKIFKYTRINNHSINPVDVKQSYHRPIHSLKLVELEILKTYIKINLVNDFI